LILIRDLRAVVIVVGSQDIVWPSAIPYHLVIEEESEDIMVGVIVRRIVSFIIVIPEGTTIGIISVTVAKRRKRKIIVNQCTREDGQPTLKPSRTLVGNTWQSLGSLRPSTKLSNRRESSALSPL
jgi:hypothetical protein